MWLPNKFALFFLAVAVLSQNAQGRPPFAQEGRYAVRNIRHISWTSEKGVSAVFEIQQDPNGYLWLNTANGVVRFDGVRFQSLEQATNNALHSSDITAAYIGPSGRIWFTTRTAGLILLRRVMRRSTPRIEGAFPSQQTTEWPRTPTVRFGSKP